MTITAIMLGIQRPNLPSGKKQTFIADVYRKVIFKALPPVPRTQTHNMTATKEANRKKLRELITNLAPISQPALTKKAKVSATTVRTIVDEFIEEGFVWKDKGPYPWLIKLTVTKLEPESEDDESA